MRESSEQVEQRAAEWLARQQGENWNCCDEVAFSAWLSASIANRVAYVRLVTAWESFGVFANSGRNRWFSQIPE
jgi:ferric-dicitrate binding protein FerR (iron transport regulator)